MSNDPIVDVVEEAYREFEEKLNMAVSMCQLALSSSSQQIRDFHKMRLEVLTATVASVSSVRERGGIPTIDQWLRSREFPTYISLCAPGCECQMCAAARVKVKRALRRQEQTTKEEGGTREMKFILHSRKHHGDKSLWDGDGVIVSDGAIGRITKDNVYLNVYAQYPGDQRPADLEIGEMIEGVEFRLSGELGVYDVYRVS